MRTTAVPDAERRQLARRWHQEDALEDEEILPDEYYRKAFVIVACGVDTFGEDRDLKVNVVQKMIENFIPSGGRQQSGQNGALSDFRRLLEMSQPQTEATNPTE